jgi:hypothetical protein
MTEGIPAARARLTDETWFGLSKVNGIPGLIELAPPGMLIRCSAREMQVSCVRGVNFVMIYQAGREKLQIQSRCRGGGDFLEK